MSFDPSRFPPVCVVDTCSVWNMLSSKLLNQAAIEAKLHFCITPVVLYECLKKPRSEYTEEKLELNQRLRRARDAGRFPVQECSLEDLLAVSEKAPKRLGSGELSCLAVTYRIRSVALMTDDMPTRTYAEKKLGLTVGTTPRLYGFLHFHMHLGDSDHAHVIAEHELYEQRPLTEFFNKTFDDAMRCRSVKHAFDMAVKKVIDEVIEVRVQ